MGYYEPTLLILYEPIRTWAGRIAVRQDTCAMIALSLNVHQKVHPIIWSTTNLPFDSLYVLPVPRPIGGVLIFCTNMLIYLNQSVPPFAVSLNSFAESSSAFPVQPQKNVKISLDCSRACFLSNDKLVISLKGGEIYVISLFIDRMRSVKRFHFEKAASSVISSCITFCGKEFLFLGSRLGNSLLLKYSERVVNVQQPRLLEERVASEASAQINGHAEREANEQEVKREEQEENDEEQMETEPAVGHEEENLMSETIESADRPLVSSTPNSKEIGSFVNNLEKSDLYGENEFIFKEQQPAENYKKRKADVLEFDDEDRELYGGDDPIFQEDDDDDRPVNERPANERAANERPTKFTVVTEDSNDLYGDSNSNQPSEKAEEKDEPADQDVVRQESNDNENCDEQSNSQVKEDNEEENLMNLLKDNGADDDLELLNENTDVREPELQIANSQNEQGDDQKQTPQQQEDQNAALSLWMAGDVALLDGEELEIFGPEENDNEKQPITLVFEVCDSILNIGPCSRVCMGELSFLAEELSKENEHQVELVTTSGYAKNGALCVLQRTVRPQIVTTYVLPKCLDMWTVYSHQKDLDFPENATGDPTHQAYLIISRAEDTMILQTGLEINELDKSGFTCDSKTIFAGNLCENRCIVQVTPDSVRLVEGTKPIKICRMGEKQFQHPIVSASLADPHGIVMLENGELLHLTVSVEANVPNLTIFDLAFPKQKAKITSCSLYKDVSGLFVTKVKNRDEQRSESARRPVSEPTKMVFDNNEEIDDLDELLYGDSDVNAIVGASIKNPPPPSQTDDQKEPDVEEEEIGYRRVKEQAPTYWLFLTRADGSLEIYSIPDIALVYRVADFALAPLTLADSDSPPPNGHSDGIHEIFVGGFGLKQSKPLLFARFKGEICIYEAFQYTETETDKHLKIRFTKMNSILLNEPDTVEPEQRRFQRYFRPFADISGYSGLFICGALPQWFFMGERGEARLHEMSIDGHIRTFSPFSNINCQKGFLYFNDNDELRIGVLPTHITYDSSWPVRKVPTRCTVHFIRYHLLNKCYVVVTSTPEEYQKIAKLGGEDKDFEQLERDDRFIWPKTEKFSVQLFSPVSCEMIPGTRIELDDWEHVTCLQNVQLQTEGTESGFKGFVALGTNYCYGEDVTNKGRIMILDIVEVVPEPGQPLTKNKIKVVYSKEQKGPVTALTQVKGYLLSSIGQKIYIWELKEDQLAGVAFIDTQIYIHSAVSIKNLILVADYYKSISLLRYQEDTKTLSLVSRDIRSFEVYACEFMVDNNLLSFIVSDADKNIILYHYQPEVRESNGGTRLIQRADFHIGARINHFFRIRCKRSRHCTEEQNRENAAKQLTMYATLDGGLGYLLPISEKIYRRLLMVQNLMNNQSPNLAGLNPKAFRLYKTSSRELLNPCKNVLDGDLLFRYTNLSIKQKNELARKIGTTTQQVTIGCFVFLQRSTLSIYCNVFTHSYLFRF